LVDVGVLAEVETAKEKLFVHSKLLMLLRHDSNAFAQYETPVD
jgi:hypothetical protein